MSDNDESSTQTNSTEVDVYSTVVIFTSTILNNIDDEKNQQYFNVMIPQIKWNNWLQGMGCAKSELKVKRYKGSQIPGHGPKENPIFYYHLTLIGIDYIKNFKKEKNMGRG